MSSATTTADRPLRVALYARTSTDRDQRPDLQLDELRAVAQRRGWLVLGEYVDVGCSGGKDRRPQLDRMMAEVQRGRVDIVACWRFDRFARSLRHLVLVLDDLRSRGIDFVSLRDAVDTSTATGRLMFHITGAFGEFEREVLRERTRAGLAAARRRGARIGRPRKLVDERRLHELHAQGYSLRGIAQALHLGASTVQRLLRTLDGGSSSGAG